MKPTHGVDWPCGYEDMANAATPLKVGLGTPPWCLNDDNSRERLQNVHADSSAFYRGLFVHKDGNRAMRMLNGAVDPDTVTFGIFTCEKLFRDVWEAYLEKTARPGVAEERVERMMLRARGTYGPFPPREDAELASAMQAFITDQPARFEESRRYFFMMFSIERTRCGSI